MTVGGRLSAFVTPALAPEKATRGQRLQHGRLRQRLEGRTKRQSRLLIDAEDEASRPGTLSHVIRVPRAAALVVWILGAVVMHAVVPFELSPKR